MLPELNGKINIKLAFQSHKSSAVDLRDPRFAYANNFSDLTASKTVIIVIY